MTDARKAENWKGAFMFLLGWLLGVASAAIWGGKQ